MDGDAQLFGALLDQLAGGGTKGVGKPDVDHHPLFKEGVGPLSRPVYELVWDHKVKGSKLGVGYDAEGDEYVDMVARGIIDPTKVVRSALQNAASIASMVLITDSLVTDIPEKEKAPPMPPDMGGMGGMM